MKSLQTVQKIARVLYVISKIALVCACVGAGGAAVTGLIFLGSGGYTGELAAVQLSLCIFLICQLITFYFICRYLKNELRDGSPFSHRGARELRKTGVITLLLPLAAFCIHTAIIFSTGAEDVYSVSYEAVSGTAMILLSYVFHYGAELEERQAGERNGTF